MSSYSGFTPFETGIPKTQGYYASTQDPMQQNLYKSLFQGISVNPAQQLSQIASGDDSYFAPMEQQALRNFRERVLPKIGSQFVGRLGGSAAQGAFAQAGADLSQDLYAERAGMRQKALQDLIGLEENLLNKNTYERQIFQKPDLWDKLQPLLPALAKAAGGGLGFAFGGPAGGMAGLGTANALTG